MEKKNKQQTGSANFLIKIYFQRNCSWQGKIQWLDKKGGSQFFRSYLEMTMLIKEAIENNEDIEVDDQLRCWEKTDNQIKKNEIKN